MGLFEKLFIVGRNRISILQSGFSCEEKIFNCLALTKLLTLTSKYWAEIAR